LVRRSLAGSEPFGILDLARVRDLGLFVGGLAVAIVLHIGDPAANSAPLCPFYAMTGSYCPGCGTLRCLHSLLHADLRSAAGYNLVTVLLAPVLLAAWVAVGLAAFTGRPIRLWVPPRWLGLALAGTLLVFWIVRNLPVDALSWMAP
jgi:hypothetical protein